MPSKKRHPDTLAEKRRELDWIARAQRRDPAALRALVEAHKDPLFAFIWRMVRDHHDAEEICQDAFLRAFSKLDTFDPQFRFSTWIFTIGYRLALNALRKRKPYAGDVDLTTFADGAESAEDRAAGTEQARRLRRVVWDAVDCLSDAQKGAVLLFYKEQLGCQEIAEVMDTPVATIKSHLHRARARLRELLEPQLTGDELVNDRILRNLAG